MLNKKRVSVLLFSSLFLLTIIPSSFALLEGLYGYFYSPMDLVSLYELWHTWVDFVVFFFIIASVSRLVFGRIYGKEGEEEHPGLKGLYIGMGLFGSLGLVLFGRYSGSWQNGILVSFGPIWFIFLLLLAIITIYRLAKGEEDKEPFTIGTIIFFLLLALFLGNLIYPNVFAPIVDMIFGNPIFALIAAFLLLLGAFSIIAKIVGWTRGKSRGGETSGSGGGSSGETSEGGGEETPRDGSSSQRQPETPQPGKIFVEIVTSPKSPYRIGQQITIAAVIKEKKGWFGKREAIGNFVCTWWINNIKLSERDQIINYTIPQDIINQIEQKVSITVEVIDTENNRSVRAVDYMLVRSSIPSLVITNPVNTQSGQRSLRANPNETLEFKYKISESHPQGIESARWFYFEGLINKPNIDNSILKKSTAFQEGDNIKQTIGQVPINLQPGKVYTIICVALDNRKKLYEIPSIKRLLADYFTLEVKQQSQPTPQPTPLPQPSPTGEVEFYLNVFDQNRQPHTKGQADFSFNANINETYYFQPFVENSDIKNYEIKIDAKRAKEDAFKYTKITEIPTGILKLNEGGVKNIICTFSKDGKLVREIKATINTEGGPFIIINIPTNREISKKNPVVVSYNVLTDFEIGSKSKDITEIRWSLQADYKTKATTDTIKDLGKGNKTSFVFQDKIPNLLPEGKYTLFAFGYANNKLVTSDYIWINLVNGGKKQPPQPKLEVVDFSLVVYDKDKKPKESHSDSFKLERKVGETLFFKAFSKKVDIKNIDVEMDYDSDEDNFDNRYKTQKAASLELKTPGTKNMMCTFIKDTKTLGTITVTINVTKEESINFSVEIYEEFLNNELKPIQERKTRGIVKADTRLKCNAEQYFLFIPTVEGDNIVNYEISEVLFDKNEKEIYRSDEREAYNNVLIGGLASNVKKVSIIFEKDKKIVKIINITLDFKTPPKDEIIKAIEKKFINPKWKEFVEWSKTQKFVGKNPSWLLFKKFLKEVKNMNPESLDLTQKEYDDLTSKVWRDNSPK